MHPRNLLEIGTSMITADYRRYGTRNYSRQMNIAWIQMLGFTAKIMKEFASTCIL